jgi:ABC-type glycerol-3-phosphate transport system substrate-binding protein
MLQYNGDTFAQAGIPEPIGGWTMSEFGDALSALDNVLDEDTAPFTATGFDNTYLLMLVAAQGGLPIDTRTSPPTINFTSPETIAAVQQVLDWVDAGYIDQGSTDGGGGAVAIGFGGGNGGSPITPTFFAGLFSNPSLSYTTYPTGSGYTPLSFDVGAGYISIDSDIPEACFRWLSHIASHPELFTGAMPAQVSLLDSPSVQSSLNDDAIEAYRTIAQQMAAPNIVNFNSTDPFLSTWLTRAMEAYLSEDADLVTELEDAQQYTLDYLACTGNMELSANLQVFQRLNECVEAVDSAIID